MDISALLLRPHHVQPGSASPYLEGFATALASVGHTPLTINDFLNSAIHFGGWMEANGRDSILHLRGRASEFSSWDPAAAERGGYIATVGAGGAAGPVPPAAAG